MPRLSSKKRWPMQKITKKLKNTLKKVALHIFLCIIQSICFTDYECVAQLVEHLTFNQRAQGSNPCTLTILSL